jgi:hypothetical protein
MAVDCKSIGMLQLMNIGKYLQRRNIFVQIVIIKNLELISTTTTTTTTKPTYYNKKPYSNYSTITKPKMDNSFELLTNGSSVSNIQKQYEILSELLYKNNSWNMKKNYRWFH